MLELTRKDASLTPPDEELVLPWDLRQRSRQRVVLASGREAAVVLAPGTSLEQGERLRSEDGTIVVVRAAREDVSLAWTDDPVRLARACYHLGNRHVALQVGPGWLRYQHDHVLDDMVRGLGLDVRAETAPFEPERGAYHGQGHGQGHGHRHDGGDGHDH